MISALIKLKYMIACVLDHANITDTIIKYKSKTKYLVLMYHRIIPYKEVGYNVQAGMYVEPETFRLHVQYLKNNYSVVPLSMIHSCIENKDILVNGKPICVLTFDDGWLDFYKYAYPILLEYSIPATVFLPTKYIGTNRVFWTDAIANYYINRDADINNVYAGPDRIVNILVNIKGNVEDNIEKAISILKEYREEDIESVLHTLNNMVRIENKEIVNLFLSWVEIREMLASGLITFGSHTDSHKILVHLSHEEIEKELLLSKNKLLMEKAVDTNFIPFCYPNGNYNEFILRKVKEAGYHIATTTNSGWNDLKQSCYGINRIALHQDMSFNVEMLKCRIAEIL